MTKRQIARKLVETEARIELLTKQLKKAVLKAEELEEELERPSEVGVRLINPIDQFQEQGKVA